MAVSSSRSARFNCSMTLGLPFMARFYKTAGQFVTKKASLIGNWAFFCRVPNRIEGLSDRRIQKLMQQVSPRSRGVGELASWRIAMTEASFTPGAAKPVDD